MQATSGALWQCQCEGNQRNTDQDKHDQDDRRMQCHRKHDHNEKQRDRPRNGGSGDHVHEDGGVTEAIIATVAQDQTMYENTDRSATDKADIQDDQTEAIVQEQEVIEEVIGCSFDNGDIS